MNYTILKDGYTLQEGDEYSYFPEDETSWEKIYSAKGLMIKKGEITPLHITRYIRNKLPA